MKIVDGFMLREVAGNYIVVAVGSMAKKFNGMITLNESSAFLWKLLETGADEESLVSAMLNEYDIKEEVAKQDVKEFVEKLTKAGFIK